MNDFFATTAGVVEDGNPALAEKLRRATPHWMRRTHATHLLEGGAELTTVRDNLRHSSLATTSMYLHAADGPAREAGRQSIRRTQGIAHSGGRVPVVLIPKSQPSGQSICVRRLTAVPVSLLPRPQKLEEWCSIVKSEPRIHGRKPGDLDDPYSWFAELFDRGITAADAVEAFISG